MCTHTTMEATASDLLDRQSSAKTRRFNLLGQTQGSEVVNLEDDSQNEENKKLSEKQNIWTEAPPLLQPPMLTANTP